MNGFERLECGNPRGLLPAMCPYCGSAQPPFAHADRVIGNAGATILLLQARPA